MEQYQIKDLSFSFGGADNNALEQISFEVKKGDFFILTGNSGSGKSTLLRLMKHLIAPSGVKSGEILLSNKKIEEYPAKTLAKDIGFVFQNPDTQIVCNTVQREMCFALENLQYKSSEILARAAEIASFFGIEKYYNSPCASLSGGQKQLLNLASVMVCEPDVLILDEPLSQLDPVAKNDFINYLTRLNKDYGITVIIAEHSLDEIYHLADKVCLLDKGEIKMIGSPEQVAADILKSNEDEKALLPQSTIFASLLGNGNAFTVKDARNALADSDNVLTVNYHDEKSNGIKPAVKIKNLSFAYDINAGFILDELTMTANFGEILCLLGGNGSGKTTLFKIIANILKAQRGKIKASSSIGYLPQNPYTAFLKNTVAQDIEFLMKQNQIPTQKLTEIIEKYSFFDSVQELFPLNPLDLSGGEAQKCAILKLLLCESEILLLDEPTKGLDNISKKQLAQVLKELKSHDKCIFCISHDIEFFSKTANVCMMLFGGKIVRHCPTREFFSSNSIYTTQVRKITKDFFDSAILISDFTGDMI